MALFRSQVLKQRFLVPRLSSAVVYYVNSHLQYAGSPTISQAVQKYGSELSRHHDQTLVATKHVTSDNLRSDNIKSIASFYHNIPRNERIAGIKILPSNIPEVTLRYLDPFINQTQLALLSLNYDNIPWCNSFKTAYLRSSRTLSGQVKLFPVVDPDQFMMKRKDSVHWSVYNYDESSELKESAAQNAVMDTNNYRESSKPKNGKHECDPLHLAIVFQSLREEIPLFFTKGQRYELYHKNVTFVNGLLGTTFRGLRAYKYSMTSMRIACQLLMTDVTMQILKITKDRTDCNIKVRWRVSGVPRFATFRSRTKVHNRYVDGFSVFEIGEDGLIHCHRLLKLIPSQNRQLDNPLWALNTVAVMSLLRQQRSFEMLARQRVEDIEETIPLFGVN